MITISYNGNIIVDTDISNWVGTESNAQQGVVIKRAEELIEKVTGDKFYQYTFDVLLDGNGKDRIMMPFQTDIISITSIAVSDITIESTLYTFQKRFIFTDPTAILINGLTAIISDQYVLFPKGVANIRVIGVTGWSTPPENIKRACVILAEDILDETLYTHYAFGSESIGAYSYSSRIEPLTGIREADELLTHYVTRKPKLGSV